MEKQMPIAPHIKNKHTDDLIDHYWGSINYVSNLIRASEIKAGLILSFYGILLNFMYHRLDLLQLAGVNKIVLYVLLAIWFAFTVTSVYYSIRCFIPRIEANYDKNIFFFKDIITKFGNIDEFSKTFYSVSLDEDQLFIQLGHQIYIISKIATLKFRDVNRALKFLGLGILMLLIIGAYFAIIILAK